MLWETTVNIGVTPRETTAKIGVTPRDLNGLGFRVGIWGLGLRVTKGPFRVHIRGRFGSSVYPPKSSLTGTHAHDFSGTLTVAHVGLGLRFRFGGQVSRFRGKGEAFKP